MTLQGPEHTCDMSAAWRLSLRLLFCGLRWLHGRATTVLVCPAVPMNSDRTVPKNLQLLAAPHKNLGWRGCT